MNLSTATARAAPTPLNIDPTSFTALPRPNRRARRALRKLGKRNYAAWDLDFNVAVMQRLEAAMAGYGNDLSEAHRQALYAIVGRFTMLCNGAVKGRFGYDLPCGGGKTQAVISWCAELVHQRKPWSVAICASRVNDLCDIKRQLIEHHNIPEAAIGLVHSYGHAAPLPPTDDNGARPILLITHNRVRGPNGLQAFEPYNGQPRNLVIWDESLIVAEHRAVECLPIEQALGWLRPVIDKGHVSDDLRAAYQYLTGAWQRLDSEMIRQRERSEPPAAIFLPPLSANDLDRFTAAIAAKHDFPSGAVVTAFLAMSQSPVRVVADASQGGGGYVTYDIVVPREMERVAVLDASWAIRDLERLDKSINADPAFKGDIKRYHNVTIHHLQAASGRGTMTKDFSQPREGRKVSREVVEVVARLPETEGILIFTFKERKQGRRAINMAEILKDDLRVSGIDVDATLPNGRPRFAWLTWGQETAASEYSYCPNVIFAGVIHRSDADLAGAIVGQSDNLLRSVTYQDIVKIRRSEVAHSLYQAMSRGSARITERGEAARMNVWLIHSDREVRDILQRVMPGAVWTDWEGVALESLTSKVTETADKIAAYLDSLPSATCQASTRTIKRDLALDTSVSKMTFTRAARLVNEASDHWTLQGRSFVRKGT